MNIYKSLVFLYNANAQSEKEIKKTIQFTIRSKTIKYSAINVEEFYSENYKILFKHIQKT